MKQLVSLIKSSNCIPPVEVFFIGIRKRFLQNWKKDTTQAISFFWQTSDPMAFQKWKKYFQLSSIEQEYCYDNFNCYHPVENQEVTGIMKGTHTDYSNTVHPYAGSHISCSAMMFHNLVDPEWVSIQCSTKLTKHVFCMVKKNTSTRSLSHAKHAQFTCK